MGEMICRHLRKKASRWARGCPGSGTDQFGRIIFMGIQLGVDGDFMGISWGCRGIWCESDLNGSYEIQWDIAGYLIVNHGKSLEKKRNDIDFLAPNIQYPSCGPQNEWIQCSPLGFRLVSDVVRMRLYWYYWKSWGARLVKRKSPLPSY